MLNYCIDKADILNLFNSFPVIEIINLLLRRITQEDKHDIYKMRKDTKMHKYTDSKPDENLEATEVYIDKMANGVAENKWIIWAIETQSVQEGYRHNQYLEY